jgi:putative copper export protein
MRCVACTTSPSIRRPGPSRNVNPDEGPLPLDSYAFGRGLAYAAILTLVGVCVFGALIPRWRSPSDDDHSLPARALSRAWSVAGGAAALLVVAHLLRAYGQVRSFLDPGEPLTWEVARPMLTQTTWGAAWHLQLLLALVTLPLAWLGRRWPALGLGALGTATLGVVITAPLTGHAAEHPWGRQLGIGLHAVHLLGGGLWIGTLFTMTVAGLRPAPTGGDHVSVARMVATFSPVALTGAALAITAGSLLAVAYVGDVSSLLNTRYGQTLLVKLTLLTLTLALGAWNWRRLRPRLGEAPATRALTRSATIELSLAALLIAATAVLVALPAPKI